MYKVFFNSRTIILDDKSEGTDKNLPGLTSTIIGIADLKPQLLSWLRKDRKDDLCIRHTDKDLLFKTFRACFKVIKASGGLVKNTDGDSLVIFRRGKWDLPKGKAEPGESPEETSIREVSEECYLKELTIIKFLITTYHIYFLEDIPVLKETKWFEMKYSGKEEPRPQINEEITRVIWLPYSQIGSISGNTFPNVLEVIKTGNL